MSGSSYCSNNKKVASFILDYLLAVVMSVGLIAQPYFYHGIIDFFETGLYLTGINAALHRQGIYNGFVILRGPLEIFFPALLMKAFGDNIKVLFGYFYISSVLSVILTALVARKILSTRLFVYLLIPVLIANTISPVYYKYWGGLRFALGMLSILFSLNYFSLKNKKWLLYSGITAATAALFSIEMGVFPFVAGLLTLLVFEKEEPANSIFAFVGGCTCIFIPFLVYLLTKGALQEYIVSTFTMASTNSRVYHFEILFPEIPNTLFSIIKCALNPLSKNFIYALPLFLYVPMSIYAVRALFSGGKNKNSAGLFCVLVYGLLMYVGSFRQLNGPQFLIGLQPAFIVFFFVMEKWIRSRTKMLVLSSGIAVFLIAYFSIFTVKNNLSYGTSLQRVVFRQTGRGTFPSGKEAKALRIKRGAGILLPDWQADEVNGVVGFIEKNAAPDDVVFSFPDQGTYNFLTDRPSFSRFTLFDMAAYRPEWTNEFFTLLEKEKPKFIICKNERDAFEPLLTEYPVVKNRERVREMVKQDYLLKAAFGHINIYELKK